jgi:hypothetical protein
MYGKLFKQSDDLRGAREKGVNPPQWRFDKAENGGTLRYWVQRGDRYFGEPRSDFLVGIKQFKNEEMIRMVFWKDIGDKLTDYFEYDSPCPLLADGKIQ